MNKPAIICVLAAFALSSCSSDEPVSDMDTSSLSDARIDALALDSLHEVTDGWDMLPDSATLDLAKTVCEGMAVMTMDEALDTGADVYGPEFGAFMAFSVATRCTEYSADLDTWSNSVSTS